MTTRPLRVRALRVWHYSGFRNECLEEEDRFRQTAEYVAAPSKAAAIRAFIASGTRRKPSSAQVSETHWPEMLTRCLAKPGAVFWCGLASRHRGEAAWHAVTP